MQSQTIRDLCCFFAAATLLGAATAHAVDGVTEINEVSITSGAGYPFTIVADGSYVLTSSLFPPPDTTAIIVSASHATIDLNGFSIVSSGGSVGSGVDASGSLSVTVRNGSIESFPEYGFLGSAYAKILETRIASNGLGGIVSFASVIVESIIFDNGALSGGYGIECYACKIENNVIESNHGDGIIGDSNVIVHNTISFNGGGGYGGGGILSFAGSTIQENTIVFNGDYGVSDSPGPSPPAPPPPFSSGPTGGGDNVIMKNTIDANSGFGVYTNATALITDNTISNNGLDGIVCGFSCAIRGNVVEGNNVSGSGNGGVTAGPGSLVNDNSITVNTGVGLSISLTAGYTNNTLDANSTTDVTAYPGGGATAHPTAGFFNLCSGAPGPAAGLCP